MFLIWWATFCSGGFGDCILGLSTSLCIAKKMNRKLLIKWDHTDMSPMFTINPEYNYYTTRPSYKYIDINSQSAKTYFQTEDLCKEWGNENVLMWSQHNLFQYLLKNPNFQDLKNTTDTYFVSDTLNHLFKDILIINPDIQKTVDSISVFDIGIHIRTKDNQIFDKELSNLQEEYIKNILKKIKKFLNDHKQTDQSIFIASDCNLTFTVSKEFFPYFYRYPGDIIHTSHPKGLSNDTESMKKVLVDFLVLSKCKKLFIGWNTNFSRVAALMDPKKEVYCFEYRSETDYPDINTPMKKFPYDLLTDYFSIGGRG